MTRTPRNVRMHSFRRGLRALRRHHASSHPSQARSSRPAERPPPPGTQRWKYVPDVISAQVSAASILADLPFFNTEANVPDNSHPTQPSVRISKLLRNHALALPFQLLRLRAKTFPQLTALGIGVYAGPFHAIDITHIRQFPAETASSDKLMALYVAQKERESLWVQAYTSAEAMAVVRMMARKRMRNAFHEALKEQKWNGDGSPMRVGKLNLLGTVRFKAEDARKVYGVPFAELVKAMKPVVLHMEVLMGPSPSRGRVPEVRYKKNYP